MFNKIFIITTAFIIISLFIFIPDSYSGIDDIPDSDSNEMVELYSFFDLRDRESYVQLTNIDSIDGTVHVQIFDVSNNCNENNFFDTYTPADTHVYNMRDIQTNNGNPSGVVLPDGAYGFVSIIAVNPSFRNFNAGFNMVGNFRIIDNNGYEYRTNSVDPDGDCCWDMNNTPLTFNFNTNNGVVLSDVVGLTFNREGEVLAADISNYEFTFNIDIYNENEVPFSCRNIIFACTDQNNPLLESLLESVGVASVASFEYGINNSIPHSKGGELLCPGNIIRDGLVTLNFIMAGPTEQKQFIGFIGLNNGAGRGSMDSFWYPNGEL